MHLRKGLSNNNNNIIGLCFSLSTTSYVDVEQRLSSCQECIVFNDVIFLSSQRLPESALM